MYVLVVGMARNAIVLEFGAHCNQTALLINTLKQEPINFSVRRNSIILIDSVNECPTCPIGDILAKRLLVLKLSH